MLLLREMEEMRLSGDCGGDAAPYRYRGCRGWRVRAPRWAPQWQQESAGEPRAVR